MTETPDNARGDVVDIGSAKGPRRRQKAAKRPEHPPPVRRRKKAPKEKKDRGPAKALLYRAVGLAIDRSELSLLPPFPRRFVAIEPSPGVLLPLEVDEQGVCRHVSMKAVRKAIMNYVTITLCGVPGYSWEVRHAQDCAEFWLSLTPVVEEPKPVAWVDDPVDLEATPPVGLTFNRLPWSYIGADGEGRTPTFDKLLGRVSNVAALVDWIGSIFDPKADRQQYVWLRGDGSDGKGALVRFFNRVLGIAFAAKAVPSMEDTHWTAGLIGKRLVAFPDTNAVGYPSSGPFKHLTGGEPVDINPKHKDPYTADLNAKFMFSSQKRPALSSEYADRRRVIYCEFRGRAVFEHDFEERLWEEGGAFLSLCIHNYRVGYPKGGPIKTDTTEIDEWTSVVEEPFEVALEQHLELVPVPAAGEPPVNYMLPVQMQRIAKACGFDTRRQGEFVIWLERTHGVKKRTVRIGGEPRKVYVGVRARSIFEQNEREKDLGL